MSVSITAPSVEHHEPFLTMLADLDSHDGYNRELYEPAKTDFAAYVRRLLDEERGQPWPKQLCPQCGREILVITLPPDLLRSYGRQPFQVWSVVEWCGHRVEGTPVPGLDGRWRLIPVLGEAG